MTYRWLCLLLTLFFLAPVDALRRSIDKGTHAWAGGTAVGGAGSIDLPDIGPYSEQFKVQKFIATGGQARVYSGIEFNSSKGLVNRSVVFRFPHGMCEHKVCKVYELSEYDVKELTSGCSLANEASDRYRQLQKFDANVRRRGVVDRSPYAECLFPISSGRYDPAFEVWENAGETHLGEFFFLRTIHGVPSMDQKRRILMDLQGSVSSLADDTYQAERCCCLKTDSSLCTTAPHFREVFFMTNPLGHACPSRYTAEPMSKCGAIVHHDIKFDNVVMRISAQPHEENWRTMTPWKEQPVVIDFGAAVRCDRGTSTGYSRDWAPVWLEDPSVFPTSECWSYDTYGVGMINLVTEMLIQLSPDHLVCLAAKTHTQAKDCGGLNVLDYLHDSRVKRDALIPVNELIEKLHKALRRSEEALDTEEALREFLEIFVEAENSTTLPLVVPSKRHLNKIWPLMRECPNIPRPRGTVPLRHLSESERETVTKMRVRALKCRFRRSTEQLHKAAREHNNSQIARLSAKFDRACHNLAAEDSSTPVETCGDEQEKVLVHMVSKGEVSNVRELLNGLEDYDNIGADKIVRRHYELHQLINRKIGHGETLLAMASRGGPVEMVALLLSRGEPNQQEMYSSIMAAASVRFNDAVLHTLLTYFEAVAFNPAMASQKLSALHDLIKFRENSVWGHLTPDEQTMSLTSRVAKTGDVKMLRTVLKALGEQKNMSLRGAVFGGGVPLMVAAYSGQAEMCKALIAEGHLPNSKGANVSTALMLAVKGGSLRCIDAIINADDEWLQSMINEKDVRGETPLHAASSRGRADIVQRLLDAGAKVVIFDNNGNTAMHTAVRTGEKALPALTVLAAAAGAKGHGAVTSNGETPLMLSAKLCNDVRAFSVLLKTCPENLLHTRLFRASPDASHNFVQAAAARGRLSCLDAATDRVPVDYIGDMGITPLMTAAARNQVAAVRQLLSKGASLSLLDDYGQPATSYMLEAWKKRPTNDLLKLFLEFGGLEIFQTQDLFGLSFLGRLAYDGESSLVKTALQVGADCNTYAFTPNESMTDDLLNRLFSTKMDRNPVGQRLSPWGIVRWRLQGSYSAPKYLQTLQGAEAHRYSDKVKRAGLQAVEALLKEHKCSYHGVPKRHDMPLN